MQGALCSLAPNRPISYDDSGSGAQGHMHPTAQFYSQLGSARINCGPYGPTVYIVELQRVCEYQHTSVVAIRYPCERFETLRLGRFSIPTPDSCCGLPRPHSCGPVDVRMLSRSGRPRCVSPQTPEGSTKMERKAMWLPSLHDRSMQDMP